VFVTASIALAEAAYPLKIKKLGWENWMWEYVFDACSWTSFAESLGSDGKEFDLWQVMGIKPKLLSRIKQELQM